MSFYRNGTTNGTEHILKPFLCGSEFPCNSINGHIVILKKFAETLNNIKKFSTCKEEEFKACGWYWDGEFCLWCELSPVLPKMCAQQILAILQVRWAHSLWAIHLVPPSFTGLCIHMYLKRLHHLFAAHSNKEGTYNEVCRVLLGCLLMTWKRQQSFDSQFSSVCTAVY